MSKTRNMLATCLDPLTLQVSCVCPSPLAPKLAISEEPSLRLEGATDPAEVAADVSGPDGEIPNDLLDDADVRLELAVNPFTAPSISKMFDTLPLLMPLPIAEVERKMPARISQDRAALAIELGFLIADGFLMVQAEQLKDVEKMAKDLTRYGKAHVQAPAVRRWAGRFLWNSLATTGLKSCAIIQPMDPQLQTARPTSEIHRCEFERTEPNYENPERALSGDRAGK